MSKFLILVPGNRWILEEIVCSEEVWSKVNASDDPSLEVIECEHPKFEDNCVEFKMKDGEDITLVRAKNGELYDWDEVYTKLQVMDMFDKFGDSVKTILDS